MFKKYFKIFDFDALTDFVYELVKRGLKIIRFYPTENKGEFTEHQLTHVAPGGDKNNTNGFVWKWKQIKNLVRKVSFDQFSQDGQQKITVTIDLNNKFIGLDYASGVSSMEIEKILNKHFKLYKDPEPHPNKSKVWEIIKNPWVVTIFGGLIVALASYYIFGIGKTKNTPLQTINNPSQEQQTNSNSLPISVYSLAKKMSEFSGTSIEREDFFKKYIGLVATDEGYVVDNSRISNGEVLVYLAKETDKEFDIMCHFGSNWAKTAGALQQNQKIKFSGIIEEFFIGVKLKECELK